MNLAACLQLAGVALGISLCALVGGAIAEIEKKWYWYTLFGFAVFNALPLFALLWVRAIGG